MNTSHSPIQAPASTLGAICGSSILIVRMRQITTIIFLLKCPAAPQVQVNVDGSKETESYKRVLENSENVCEGVSPASAL